MYGLCYYNDYVGLKQLPLVKCTAKAFIMDVSAQVELRQSYNNDTNDTIECSYTFPVPARGAVHRFVMVKEDGTRVVGKVMEKEAATETYEAAIEQGKLASIMTQDTTDTFSVLVGNVLPKERVTIELAYATELSEGEKNDSARFHLPAHIGARYGTPPPGAFARHSSPPTAAFSKSNDVEFELSLSIEAASPIRQISCPSHPITTELGPDPALPNVDALPVANYARVSFATTSSLDKDFILEIHAAGLDAPRCFAEVTADSSAFALTLVPKFKLPDVTEQEYLFLVDRSGSMNGERISMAKKALVVLLRSLPHKGTHFNVLSFGSTCSALWEGGSKSYGQQSLKDATDHVDTMGADYGGTEMRRALEETFKLRDNGKHTSVFLLTDGDAWELEEVFKTVDKAVAASSPSTPLRVFVLGIGNSASTSMCEGIARRGHGAVQFVVDGESFTGKTARLLKAAKTPQLLNIRLEVSGVDGKTDSSEVSTEDFELVDAPSPPTEADLSAQNKPQAPISLFDEGEDPLADSGPKELAEPTRISLPPPAPLQLAPHKIANLYPGTRTTVYGIVRPASALPTSVQLRAELATGQSIELSVPVVTSQLSTAASSNAIHILTARKLIQDLEDGQDDFGIDKVKDEDLLARTIKAHVVRLGETYSLSSTYTSFVAVDDSEADESRRTRQRPRRPKPAPPPPFFGGPPGGVFARGGPAPRTKMATMAMPAPRGFGNATFGGGGGGNGGAVFGGAPAPMMTMMSMAAVPPPPPPSMPVAPAPMASFGAPPPASASSFNFGSTIDTVKAATPKDKPLTDSDLLDAIARHQNFDGSFSPDVSSLLKFSSSLPELNGVSDVVRATIAVLVYWEQKMETLRDEWSGMADKAREFVLQALEADEGEDEDEPEAKMKEIYESFKKAL